MTNNAILKDIICGISKARFLIADITNYNSNVMYELGIAYALQKEVIMIYQKRRGGKPTKLPFDVSHIRTIQYENDAIGGQEMKDKLSRTVDYVLGQRSSPAGQWWLCVMPFQLSAQLVQET
jgi:nucleoside 2-deoxyribosyltransferase